MKYLYTISTLMLCVVWCHAKTPQDYAGEVRIEPVRFAEVGDNLVIEFDIHVSREAMNVRQSWTIAPQLTNGAYTMELPYALINGRQKARHYHRKTVFENTELVANPPHFQTSIPKGTDTVIRYTLTRPYSLWMDKASLEVKQELLSSAEKKQLFLTGGFGMVELEPREPYQINPHVNYLMPEREDKRRRAQGQAYLDFQVGRSVILPDYRRNPEELQKIYEVVSKIQNDPGLEIIGVYIEGYASPEGSLSLNERLSSERAEALGKYISSSFGLDGNIFRTSSAAEDWDGLRLLIDDSSIGQKERILAIIDGDEHPDIKEQRLKNLGAPWHTLLTEYFPSLRRVEYRIDFTVKDYTVDESRDLASRRPEMLSHRELFILTQTYEKESGEREKLFETIYRLYPDDVVATVNSAAGMLERGEYATAKRYLDRVADDERSWNNLGIYWLRENDPEQALIFFEKALKNGIPEAEHNIMEARAKRDDNKLMERYIR